MHITVHDKRLHLYTQSHGGYAKCVIELPATAEGARMMGEYLFRNGCDEWNGSFSLNEFEDKYGIDLFSLVEDAYKKRRQLAFEDIINSVRRDYDLTEADVKDIWSRFERFAKGTVQ